MKALFTRRLATCALLAFSTQAAFSQVSLTATGGTSTGSFTTLNAAFAAINAGTHTGSIVISITGNTTEPSTPTPLVASGSSSASYTKILIKAASGNDTINSASSPSSYRGIIELAGADNVTIDGDDPSTAGSQNLTIMAAMSSTTGIACIRLGSSNTSGTGGASNDTIKNCIIIGSRNSASSTTTNFGIQYNNVSSSNTSSGGAYGNVNNAFIGNTILRCRYGMYLYGASSTYPNTGTLVEADTIGSSTAANNVWYGIYAYYCADPTTSTGGPVIINNDIQAGGSGSASPAGIYFSSSCGGAIISGNNIHDVFTTYTYSSSYGIGITSSYGNNNIQIYNNFIRDITASNYSNTFTAYYYQNYGICLNGGTGYKINHNTIYLNALNGTSSSTSNEVSACLGIFSTAVTVSQILNNIFINNQGTVSSNACAVIAQSTSNFSTGSVNYNDLYVNGSGTIGYLGGNQTTLSAWRTASGKDSNSITTLPSFSSSTNLHIPNSSSSQLESAGASVSVTGINKDIDGQTRPGPTGSTYGGASAPDIGADEFDGVPVRAPSVSGLSASAISCTSNVSHTITATIVANSGTISSATINYNNGSAGTATMTLSSGTSANGVWTGTIPAASAGGTMVTWSISATSSIPLTTIATGASYMDNPLATVTAAAYAAPANVCTGSSTTLSARAYEIAPVQVGAGSTTNQYGGSPFYHGWGGARVEYIFTASELHTAGLDSGNISALSFDVTGAGASGGYAGFTISMGTTATQTAYSYPPSSVGGLSVVYTTTSDTPTVGINTYNFSTPFYWNGTDNLVVAVCWSNNNTGGTSATVKWDYYSASHSMYVYGDNQTVSTICGATGSGTGYYASTTTGRPVTYFTGPKTLAVTAYSWSNGASTVGTTNPLSLTPAASSTYTATLTATSGCTKNTNGVAVTLIPLPSAPTATNSLQCGVHVPTASVSGATADSTYRWYDAALGGNLVQTGGSTYTSLVSKTDTFYVSIFNGQCESSRTPVKITVTQPDAVSTSSPTNPYCANAPVSLVATKATGTNTYTYSWAATPTANSGITGSVSGDSISVTPLAPGTFVYTVTAVDGACVAMSSDTIDILNPPPAPIVTPNTPDSFCLGGSVALTAAPGTAVAFSDMFETFPLTQWTTTGSGVTYNQSTTYYQQGSSSIWMQYNTSSNANLEMANSINLTQYGSPVLYFYHICATEAYFDFGYVQYSTDNGATWTSFPSSAYSGSGTLKNSVVSFDKSSYSDWSSQFSGSTTNPGTGPATTLWKKETIDLSSYATATQFKIRFHLTSDGSVNYYGWLIDSVAIAATPAVTYSWTSNPVGFSDTAHNTTATPPTSGTYVYTGYAIGTNGCRTGANTANIEVHPLPAFSFVPANAAVCFGHSLTIAASGADSMTWSPATGLNTTVGDTVIASPTTSTTYKVIGVTQYGCVDSTTKQVTVNTLPTVTITPSAATICFGKFASLKASGANTYSWAPTVSYSTLSGDSVRVSPAASQSYTIMGTDTNGCADTVMANITVNALPNVSVSATDTIICGSGSVSLTASGALSYTWSPATGLSATTGSGVIASPTTRTTYVATGTDANGCQDTGKTTISVYALPVVVAHPTTASSVCGGYSIKLWATGASTYAWSPSGSLNTATGDTAVATPSATTTYIITGTDIHGCMDTVHKMVTVNYGPSVSVTPTNPTICAGDTVVFRVTGTASGYVWTPSTGLDTNKGTKVVARPSSTTTYSITGLSSSGCNTLVQEMVTVLSVPNVSLYASKNSTLCWGDSVQLFAFGAATYAWSPSTTLSASNGSNVWAYPDTIIRYRVVGTASNGCTDTAFRTVNAFPRIDASISPAGKKSICQNDSITLIAKPGYDSYKWMIYGVPITPLIGNSFTTGTGGFYTLTISDSNGCLRSSSQSTIITVVQRPFPSISQDGAWLVTGSGYLHYQWFLGGTAIPGADSMAYLPTKGGSYTVEVTSDTATNCPGLSAAFLFTPEGVGSTALSDAVQLFPNPSQNLVNIQSPVPVGLRVTGMDGKLIFQGKDLKQLSVAGWPDGVYQVMILDQKGRFIKAVKLTKLSQ